MRLIFKQRIFTLLDNYKVYDTRGNVVYSAEGQFAMGHRLKIYNSDDREVGELRQRLLTFLPAFEMYLNGAYFGCVTKRFSLFSPKFDLDCNGWRIQGDFFEWDYQILTEDGRTVATASKEISWGDTYIIDVAYPEDAVKVLLVVLAIDAEKCSRS